MAKQYINRDAIVIPGYTALDFSNIVAAARNRAKQKGVAFDGMLPILKRVVFLARSQYGMCASCKKVFIKGTHKATDNSLTIHRLIPEKGYTVDNVRVICRQCNNDIGESFDMAAKAKAINWQVFEMSCCKV